MPVSSAPFAPLAGLGDSRFWLGGAVRSSRNLRFRAREIKSRTTDLARLYGELAAILGCLFSLVHTVFQHEAMAAGCARKSQAGASRIRGTRSSPQRIALSVEPPLFV